MIKEVKRIYFLKIDNKFSKYSTFLIQRTMHVRGYLNRLVMLSPLGRINLSFRDTAYILHWFLAAHRMHRSSRLMHVGVRLARQQISVCCPNSKFRAIELSPSLLPSFLSLSLSLPSRIQGCSTSVYRSRSREWIRRLNANPGMWMSV